MKIDLTTAPVGFEPLVIKFGDKFFPAEVTYHVDVFRVADELGHVLMTFASATLTTIKSVAPR